MKRLTLLMLATGFLLNGWAQPKNQHDQGLEILDEAVTLLNKGRHNEAYMRFADGIAVDPGNAELYFGKANAAFNLNLADSALANVNHAIAIAGEQSELYNLKANVYFRLRKHELAIDNFTKAIDLNATSNRKIDLMGAHFNRGSSQLVLKQYKLAKKDFDKVLEINPRFIQAYHNRGVCYLRTDQLKKSCTDFEKAVGMGSPRSAKYLEENCK